MKKKLLLTACACTLFTTLASCNNSSTPSKVTYNVTTSLDTGANISGLQNKYEEGANVTFTVNVTDQAYQIDAVYENNTTLTPTSSNNYSFVMPKEDVVIKVKLKIGKYAVTYTLQQGVSIPEFTSGTYFNEGDTVSFTVKVTDQNKKVKKVFKNKVNAIEHDISGVYHFTMPRGKVDLTVELKDIITTFKDIYVDAMNLKCRNDGYFAGEEFQVIGYLMYVSGPDAYGLRHAIIKDLADDVYGLAYFSKEDASDLSEGIKVSVKGDIYNYRGTIQFKNNPNARITTTVTRYSDETTTINPVSWDYESASNSYEEAFDAYENATDETKDPYTTYSPSYVSMKINVDNSDPDSTKLAFIKNNDNKKIYFNYGRSYIDWKTSLLEHGNGEYNVKAIVFGLNLADYDDLYVTSVLNIMILDIDKTNINPIIMTKSDFSISEKEEDCSIYFNTIIPKHHIAVTKVDIDNKNVYYQIDSEDPQLVTFYYREAIDYITTVKLTITSVDQVDNTEYVNEFYIPAYKAITHTGTESDPYENYEAAILCKKLTKNQFNADKDTPIISYVKGQVEESSFNQNKKQYTYNSVFADEKTYLDFNVFGAKASDGMKEDDLLVSPGDIVTTKGCLKHFVDELENIEELELTAGKHYSVDVPSPIITNIEHVSNLLVSVPSAQSEKFTFTPMQGFIEREGNYYLTSGTFAIFMVTPKEGYHLIGGLYNPDSDGNNGIFLEPNADNVMFFLPTLENDISEMIVEPLSCLNSGNTVENVAIANKWVHGNTYVDILKPTALVPVTIKAHYLNEEDPKTIHNTGRYIATDQSWRLYVAEEANIEMSTTSKGIKGFAINYSSSSYTYLSCTYVTSDGQEEYIDYIGSKLYYNLPEGCKKMTLNVVSLVSNKHGRVNIYGSAAIVDLAN